MLQKGRKAVDAFVSKDLLVDKTNNHNKKCCMHDNFGRISDASG